MNGTAYLCGSCASITERTRSTDKCPQCGSSVRALLQHEYIVGFSPGSLPCPNCYRSDQEVVFRGWSRVWALLFWAWEQRRAAYLCADCARQETAINLVFTALLGWWSIPSFFFYAPRATYYNWRAAFRSPTSPGDWGAVHVGEFLHEERQEQQPPVPPSDFDDSPLRFLTAAEQELLLRVSALYELLQVSPAATRSEIKAAYRAQAKAYHPDVTGPDPAAVQMMVEINQAWEILGSEKLREAYDWLEARR